MNELLVLLIPALIQVESAGRVDAIGDNGQAVGCLQIHESCWKDGLEYFGGNWTYKLAIDPDKSKTICKSYLTRYGLAYEKQTGKKATMEVLSRIWNGGPAGWKKQSTVKYWHKVKKELERMKP